MTNSEAIAVLMEQKRYVHENSVPDQALDMGIKALKSERKKGFWEWGEDEDYRCSNCQKYVYGCLGEVLSGHYKYCPFCGSAMEGEEDENDN